MPIRVRVDAELGLIVVGFAGTVTQAEVDGSLAPLLDRPELSLLPLMLADMTAAEATDAPSALIGAYARRIADNVDAKVAPGSKMALVAVRDEFFGLARMYEMHRGKTPVEIRVFRDRREAEDWLGLDADFEQRLKDVDGVMIL